MNTAASTPYASASLYVGDLHTEVTEALLCDIFNAVGPVASIRVCRDAVTRRSLGYAYVNFHMMVDAERALDTMNYTMIKGRPIRIMWSHRDPSIRKSGKGNIFIKNLDKSIDNKMLYDTFCTFGNILSCKIAYDEEGRSKGYGFVHYETEEAAETAIDKVDGKMLKEKIVYVGKFKRKAERELEDGSTEKKYTNIFVKNLDEEVTEEDLRSQFGAFGDITSLALMKDETSKSKGFAFINFEGMDTARNAVEEKNGFEFKGKAMYVGRAQKKSERMAELKEKFDKIKQERINKYQGVNLYVKNLDEALEDSAFRTAFEEYGQITSCKIMRDDKGNAKGFGFVCYTTPEEATKAVTEMNGKILASKPIYVALAQRKEQRRAQLEAQMAQRVQQSRMANGPQGMPGIYPPQGPAVFYPMQAGGRGQMYYQQPITGQGVPRRYPQQQGGKGGQQFQQGGGPQGYMVQGPQGSRQPRQNQRRQGPGGPQQGPKGGKGRQGQGAPQPGRGGPQFQQAARNVPPAPAPAPPAAPAAAAPAPSAPAGPVDFAAQLAAVPAEQQKMMLGERLFPLIEKHHEVGEQAGKITGMLLDMDTPELLHLIESPEALRQKVVEAINVLAQHGMAHAIQE
jgi:polyadenylate-binding protein